MPTPRRTSPGRANAEKERTSTRGVARREYSFGKRQAAAGRTVSTRTAPKPSPTPTPRRGTGTGPFAAGLASADLLKARGSTALGRRLR